MSYDPDACRVLWVSHVEEDIQKMFKWVSIWDEVNAWTRGPGKNASKELREVQVIQTIPQIIPRTIPAPTPVLCGVSRVISIGETTSDYLFTTIITEATWDVPRPTSLPNWDIDTRNLEVIALPAESLPRPACHIRNDDCPNQWRLFRDHFSNWTTTLDHINPHVPFTGTPCEGGEGCAALNDHLDTVRIDFDLFLAWRGSNAYKDHDDRVVFEHSFLEGCSPVLQNKCLAQSGASQVDALWLPMTDEVFSGKNSHGVNTLIPMTTILEKDRRCVVEADQFVLIYFPTNSNISRDVCADDGWGENVLVMAPNRTATRTATLDEIVFASRSDCKIWSFFFVDIANFRCIVGKPRSTMYPKDPESKWTFYDDHVYLAFNTVWRSSPIRSFRTNNTMTDVSFW